MTSFGLQVVVYADALDQAVIWVNGDHEARRCFHNNLEYSRLERAILRDESIRTGATAGRVTTGEF